MEVSEVIFILVATVVSIMVFVMLPVMASNIGNILGLKFLNRIIWSSFAFGAVAGAIFAASLVYGHDMDKFTIPFGSLVLILMYWYSFHINNKYKEISEYDLEFDPYGTWIKRGHYKKDKKDGKWEKFQKIGYETYSKDKLHGPSKIEIVNSRKFAIGSYNSNFPGGLWKIITIDENSEDKILSELPFSITSVKKAYNDFEFEFINGKLNGSFELYHWIDGESKVLEKVKYLNGLRIGVNEQYYQNGKIKTKWIFERPAEVVEVMYYYKESGTLEMRKLFKGDLEFEYKYYSDGRLMHESIYREGVRVGTWKFYKPDGSIKEEIWTDEEF